MKTMNNGRPRKLFITTILFVAAVCVLWFSTGPITGCFTLSDFTTEGHTFIYFSNGKSWWLNEFDNKVHPFGDYAFESGVGWVWTDGKNGRRVLVKPHLLYARFEPLDDKQPINKLPFEWRDLNVFKTTSILKEKATLLEKSSN
jgi:hypothetical protein